MLCKRMSVWESLWFVFFSTNVSFLQSPLLTLPQYMDFRAFPFPKILSQLINNSLFEITLDVFSREKSEFTNKKKSDSSTTRLQKQSLKENRANQLKERQLFLLSVLWKLFFLFFAMKSNLMSTRRLSRADGVELSSPCIKIGYSKPTRAESREGTFIPDVSSRAFLGDVTLDSDWLAKYRFFVLVSDWLTTAFHFRARAE